jgi:hypothetical protein
VSVPSPYGLSLNDWADQVVFELQSAGPVPILNGPGWQEWAERLLELNPSIQQAAPAPSAFTDWQEWAARFAFAVN